MAPNTAFHVSLPMHAFSYLARSMLLVCSCGMQVLCDRLGIFVDGQLVCIGNPKELTARYGGYVVSQDVVLPSGISCPLSAFSMRRQLCCSSSVCHALGIVLKALS